MVARTLFTAATILAVADGLAALRCLSTAGRDLVHYQSRHAPMGGLLLIEQLPKAQCDRCHHYDTGQSSIGQQALAVGLLIRAVETFRMEELVQILTSSFRPKSLSLLLYPVSTEPCVPPAVPFLKRAPALEVLIGWFF